MPAMAMAVAMVMALAEGTVVAVAAGAGPEVHPEGRLALVGASTTCRPWAWLEVNHAECDVLGIWCVSTA